MTVEHFPAGIPVTALNVLVTGVGITADKNYAIILAPQHSPGKRLVFAIDQEGAESLSRNLTAAMQEREAQGSNSN